MHVVGHEAVSKDLKPRLSGILYYQLEITLSVIVPEEYIRATIAPLGDMVRKTWDHDSGDSGHEADPQGRSVPVSDIGGPMHLASD